MSHERSSSSGSGASVLTLTLWLRQIFFSMTELSWPGWANWLGRSFGCILQVRKFAYSLFFRYHLSSRDILFCTLISVSHSEQALRNCFQRSTGFSLVLTTALSTWKYLKILHQNQWYPPANAQNLQICSMVRGKNTTECAPSTPLMAKALLLLPSIFLVPLRIVIYQYHSLKCLLWETSTRDPS